VFRAYFVILRMMWMYLALTLAVRVLLVRMSSTLSSWLLSFEDAILAFCSMIFNNVVESIFPDLASYALSELKFSTMYYGNLVKLAVALGPGLFKIAIYWLFLSMLAEAARKLSYRNRLLKTYLWTLLIHVTSWEIAEDLRSRFRVMKFSGADHFTDNHSHPLAAKIRTQLDTSINEFAQHCGYEVFSISMSNADEKRLCYGNRQFHTAKDMAYAMREDSIPDNALIKMNDVDFYLDDLEDVLLLGRPVLLQTFVPTIVAGSIPDGMLQTGADNRIRMTMIGGAKYEHKLWEYDSDHIVVRSWFRTYVYLVESIVHPDDPSRRVVGLFPKRVIYGPWGQLYKWFPGTQLQRRNFLHASGLVSTRFFTRQVGKTVMYTSVTEPNKTTSVTLPDIVIDACWQRYCRTTAKTEVGSLESIIDQMLNMKTDDRSSYLYPLAREHTVLSTVAFQLLYLFEHYPSFFSDIKRPYYTIPEYREHNYTVLPQGKILADDPRPSMRALFTDEGQDSVDGKRQQPWMTTAVSPTQCKTNEESCIQGRVTDVINTRTPPKKYDAYATQFIGQLVGDKRHTLIPMSYEDAADRQTTPSQKNILARAACFLGLHFAGTWVKNRVSAFQKREAYGKVTYPRNISTTSGGHKWKFARYTYVATDLLKRTTWYAFGKTPLAVARAVCELCRPAKYVIPTDFGKFDGRHSKWLAEKEEEFYLTAFSPRYHQELSRLHWDNFQCRAVTRHGVKYNTGWSRLSGSMDTSLANTFDNALVAYITLREDGLDHDQAWKRLGLYGGDDGLTPDVSPATYQNVANKIGLELKADMVQRGQPVPFLGRYFVNPWVEGGNHSICDIPRQAQKLHLTTASRLVPNEMALLRKAQGYMLTDRDTPIIGKWAEKIVETYGNTKIKVQTVDQELMDRELSWWGAECLRHNQYFPQLSRNENAAIAEKLWGKECGMTQERVIWAESQISLGFLFVNSTEPVFKRDVSIGVRAVVGSHLREPQQTVPDAVEGPRGGVHLVADQRLQTNVPNQPKCAPGVNGDAGRTANPGRDRTNTRHEGVPAPQRNGSNNRSPGHNERPVQRRNFTKSNRSSGTRGRGRPPGLAPHSAQPPNVPGANQGLPGGGVNAPPTTN